MKRKIRLGALLSVSVLMLALLIGGLYGTFSDEETSIGNTFSAGSLNLVSVIAGSANVGDAPTVNENEDGINDNVTFGTVQPGDNGTITWTLTNDGNIDGTLEFTATATGSENGQTEPEALVDDTPTGSGELFDQLTCYCTITGWAPEYSGNLTGLPAFLNGYSGTLANGTPVVVTLSWEAASGTFTNAVQTDTAQLDISFYLEQ